MKMIRFLLYLVFLLVNVQSGLFAAVAAKKVSPKVGAAKISVAPKKTPKIAPVRKSPSVSATALADVPYLKEMQTMSFPAEQMQMINKGWIALYEVFQKVSEKSSNTMLTPQQNDALASFFAINTLGMMEDYLNPKTFPTLPNDPESLFQTNYATQHLRKAVVRLGSTFEISYNNGTPTTTFYGDNRDIGVIVNIQNNTNAQFTVSQVSLDGKSKVEIGRLNPGLNPVNLHTAALQIPATVETLSTVIPSAYSFDFQEIGGESPIFISVRMMSGTELVTFLQTLPRKNKDIVEMNGLPTSPEYLANPQDWYIVLIQNATPTSAQKRNYDQRIQAINISTCSNSYLLTMQINDEMITQNTLLYANKPSVTDVYQPSSTFLEWQIEVARKKRLEQVEKDGTNEPKKLQVYQSSFTSLQLLTNQQNNVPELPFVILPEFLYDLSEMQAYWMLMITTYLSAGTKFEFFKKAKLGNAFEYFEQLGCFDVTKKYAFFIDLYNRFQPNYTLYNAPWLMAHAIYETDLQNCSDIPQLYTAQDSYGNFVVNEHKYYFINFLAAFVPKIEKISNQDIFEKSGFNVVYAYPLNQRYSLVINALRNDIKEGVFATLHQPQAGVYQLTFKNKGNKILASQYVYMDSQLANVQISFINQVENWIGSAVPNELIHPELGQSTYFKVTYEFSSANNKHILLAQSTSAIDKQQVFLPLQFTEFPIQNLYIDVFRELNTVPYTHCSIIKNGNLPAALENLSVGDWRSGIYMVPGIANNDHLTSENPGALTLLFYKADKTFLGEVTISGLINNSSDTGIRHPASIYNVHLSKYNCQVYLYLSTGIFLQYNDISLQNK